MRGKIFKGKYRAFFLITIQNDFFNLQQQITRTRFFVVDLLSYLVYILKVGDDRFLRDDERRHDKRVEILITRSGSIAMIVETIRYGI